MTRPTCATCEFYAPLHGRDQSMSVCHRNPPTVMPMHPPRFDATNGEPIPPGTWSVWTNVRPEDWCGQHRVRGARTLLALKSAGIES